MTPDNVRTLTIGTKRLDVVRDLLGGISKEQWMDLLAVML